MFDSQADEIRRKTEERRYQKMADAARRKEQELQRKAEQERLEAVKAGQANRKVIAEQMSLDHVT